MIGAIYFLINVAYFAAVPKEDMLHSGRILAASFFRNVFGVRAERALSVFIVLCAFGNVLAVLFSQGRSKLYFYFSYGVGGFSFTNQKILVIQALGREGVLPFSRFWASNRPFKSPAAGLFEHYVVAVVIMLAPPPGDAHNFLLK